MLYIACGHMIRRIVVVMLITSIAVLLNKQSARAFSSFNFLNTNIKNYHAIITFQALNQMFSRDAFKRIVDGNDEQDYSEYTPHSVLLRLILLPKLLNYNPVHHYDRNPNNSDNPPGNASILAAAASANYIKEQRMKVIQLICSGQYKDALKELGHALHTRQDFFSHSNSVDPIPPQELTCIPFPQLGLHLTSYNPCLLCANPEEPDDDPELYTHGSCAKDYPGKNHITGEAKDDPNFFMPAYNAAIQDTADFVNALKTDITSGGCSNSNGTDAWNNFLNWDDTQPSNSGDDMSSAGLSGEIITSGDPNDKTGSQGVGVQQYIAGATPLRYAIFFSNRSTATAPAQDVVITDQLDVVHDDLSTFSLGPIAFTDQVVSPPAGLTTFMNTVDLRPANNLLVQVNANLDVLTGLLTWRFTSLDPTTHQPPTDPSAGFLPPGGIGSVLFTVMPKQGLATNIQIQNQATIVFDVNPPISTQMWLNTLDNDKPTGHVLPLPSVENAASFMVQWTGTDVGSGVNNFTIFVSDNGGPFTAWLTNTTAMSDNYPGVAGHTYGFFSQARDLAGNVEALKTQAEATTQVVADTTPPVTIATASPAPNANGWNNTNVTVTLNSTDNEPGGTGVKQVQFSLAGASSGTQTVPGSSAAVAITNEGVTTLTYSATDNAGNQEAPKTLTVQIDKTPPAITVLANPTTLWPPNGKMVPVTIAGAMTDTVSGVNASTATYAVTDEYGSVQPSGKVTLGANGGYAFTIQLQASRNGDDTDGRQYTITVSAQDNAGNTGSASTGVTVPHDQGH